MVATLRNFAEIPKVKFHIPLHKKLQVPDAKETYSEDVWV